MLRDHKFYSLIPQQNTLQNAWCAPVARQPALARESVRAMLPRRSRLVVARSGRRLTPAQVRGGRHATRK